MTKDAILKYIEETFNEIDSKEMSVTAGRFKDKVVLMIQTFDEKEKFIVSVKRME